MSRIYNRRRPFFTEGDGGWFIEYRWFFGQVASLVGAAVLVIILAGLIYESLSASRDESRFAHLGERIDMGGYRLNLNCSAPGPANTPTVILEASEGQFSYEWLLVMPDISSFGRVCAYDRGGQGWSDRVVLERTPINITTELHTLLKNGGVQSPYILVGAGSASRYTRLFAQRYAEEVAGVVLVEPRSSFYDQNLNEWLKPLDALITQTLAFKDAALGRLGILRIFGRAMLKDSAPKLTALPDETFYAAILMPQKSRALQTKRLEMSQIEQSDAALLVEMPEHIPLIVLTHGKPWLIPQLEKAWQDAQFELMGLSPQGRLFVAEQSDGAIASQQPELVVQAVKILVEKYLVDNPPPAESLAEPTPTP